MTQSNNDKPIGILKIKPKGKKFFVTFDQDELELTEELMVTYRVSLDKRYTEAEFKQLKTEAKIGKSLDKAINYIFYKPRSEKEVYEYLKKEKLEEKDINKIITKLKKNKLINDELYVDALIQDFHLKLKGLHAFKYELILKGIDDSLINKALLNYHEEEMLEELIVKYQKEADRLNNLPVIKQKQKIRESLIRRGFENQTINEVLNQLLFTEDLEETFLKELSKIQQKTNDYNKQLTYLISKGFNYQLIKEYLKKS